MTTPLAADRTREDEPRQSIKRRGVLAATWAAVAAFVLD
jgi:hypothetical protein